MTGGNRKLATNSETWLAGWYRELGALVDELDGADIPERLVRALTHLVPFELAAVFVYRGRSRPLNLFDNFELADAK